MGDEPLQGDVDVILFFARNAVTANFSILNRVQVEFLYEAVFVQGVRQVPFIAQHQNRYSGQLRLLQQVVQLVPAKKLHFTTHVT